MVVVVTVVFVVILVVLVVVVLVGSFYLRICLAAGSGDWRLNAGVRGRHFDFHWGSR